MIIRGDALELLESHDLEPLDLVVTDPPYAFGGSGDEHELSATVAVVLRETARRLKKGRWMIVMCAASWRSTSYMVDAVRGVVQPVRIARWNKPVARTKARTPGWKWAGVNVIAFRKGTSEDYADCSDLDHITAAPVTNGRRAELPREVADWMVRPFAVHDGAFLDPFAGSGVIVRAAADMGMRAVGFERKPLSDEAQSAANVVAEDLPANPKPQQTDVCSCGQQGGSDRMQCHGGGRRCGCSCHSPQETDEKS